MKFSLTTLSFLAYLRHASAFVPGSATPRSFAIISPTTRFSANIDQSSTTPVSEQDETYLGNDKEALEAARASRSSPQTTVPTALTPADLFLQSVDANFPIPPEVFKGIALGSWDTIRGTGDINDFTVFQVFNKFVARDGPGIFASLLGKSKTAPMTFTQEAFTDLQGFKYTVPTPEEYKFFGNGNHAKQLPLLLKTNPFMASALTETKHGFELKSYDPQCSSQPTLYQQIIETLTGEGRRVNFQFDKKMDKITSFQVFDLAGNELTTTDHLDQEYYASAAMYNVFFYASSVHATIHVLHYLMTSAFVEATKDFDDMHQLAKSYAKNIRNKYIQVGTLLITDPNPTIAYGPDGTTVTTPQDASLITEVNGMGSSQAVRPILEKLLNQFGKAGSANALLDGLMNVSEESMERAGILTEFRKHVDLVKPFANKMRKAFKTVDRKKFYAVEAKLDETLKDCGTFESNIDDLRSWLEVMSVTGIIHGATLSYSRLAADSDIIRWRNIRSTTWDAADINVINGVLGTIVGAEEGRHVMGSEMDGEYHEVVQDVLDTFDKRAQTLKMKHKKELLKDRDVFNNYGFILTDYGPDNFDGKQLTIATYI